jgi:hypothetical protein
MTVWDLFLRIYIVVTVIFFISSVADDFYDRLPNTPKDVYDDSSNLNIFGSFIAWIFLVFINPIAYICKLVGWYMKKSGCPQC